MPKPKRTTNDKKASKLSSSARVAIVVAVITSLIGLIGTMMTLYMQEIYRPILLAKTTQTARVVEATSVQERSQTETAILTFYVKTKQASVYKKDGESFTAFETLHHGDPVEVLDATDPTWLYITYLKNTTIRITGYVSRDQFSSDFVPTATDTVTVTP